MAEGSEVDGITMLVAAEKEVASALKLHTRPGRDGKHRRMKCTSTRLVWQ